MRFPLRSAIALAFLVSVFPLSAQIRDYIFVVRPSYSEEVVSFSVKNAEAIAAEGYDDFSKIMKDLPKGGFGSGFLYVAPSGDNYVVTNRHVVIDAKEVSLESEAASGEKRKFEHCRVVAVDDELDLALIAFPNGDKPYKAGMDITDAVPEDGTEVWTAGYPGLGKDPAWQLGKGTITNSRARIDDLVDTDRSFVIQHSAQVDHGNSGGPLMIAHKGKAVPYTVIGVNTWKMREATNMSLPGVAVIAFIDRTLKNDAAADKKALNERLADFAKTSAVAQSDDLKRMVKMARFVSLDYAMRSGKDAFLQVLSSAPSRVRNTVVGWYAYSPLEGFRMALAYNLDKKFRKDSASIALTKPAPEAVAASDGKSTVAFSTPEGKKVDFDWRKEQGAWRLDKESGLAVAEEKAKQKTGGGTSSVSIEKPYSFLMSLHYGKPDGADGLFGLNVMLNLGHNPFFMFGFGCDAGSQKSAAASEFDSALSDFVMRIKLNGRLQLPIVADIGGIAPFAEASVGMQVGDDNTTGSYFSYAGGVQIFTSARPKLVLGGSFGKESISPFMPSSNSGSSQIDRTFFSVWVGFAF